MDHILLGIHPAQVASLATSSSADSKCMKNTEAIIEELRRNEALGFLPYRCCRLLILTNWAYPYGGGEAFLKDSAEFLMKSAGDTYTEVLWLSFQYFSDMRVHVPHERFQVIPWPGFEMKAAFIHAPGPMTREKLALWVALLDPDVIHHQGSDRIMCVNLASEMNIPILTGFHFWHGALSLSHRHGNANMHAHLDEHHIDHEFYQLIELTKTYSRQKSSSSSIEFYWASSFMKDILLKVAEREESEENTTAKNNGSAVIEPLLNSPVIPPVSSETSCCSTGTRSRIRNMAKQWNTRIAPETSSCALSSPWDVERQVYITQINVHAGKGSDVFRYCAINMPTCRFQCVVTDSSSNGGGGSGSRFPDNVLVLPRTDKIATVYERTKILIIPSVVDETFCRVAFEGLMNGLPIVASPSGYMKTMLEGCAGCILMPSCTASPTLWKNVLEDLVLFSRDQVLSHMAVSSRARYEELVNKFQANAMFSGALHKLFTQGSRRRNVMIFAPWADQGLGVQARNYVRILHQYGENVQTFIFSFKPYYAGRHQRDSAEWAHPHVYYSDNIREKVTDEEIRKFVRQYQIGTAIIPETCWERVFQIAALLSKELHVRTYAVPNVEILRTCELDAHEQFFDALLCNNAICQHVLYRHSPLLGNMAIQIGYAIAYEQPKKEASMQLLMMSSTTSSLSFRHHHHTALASRFVQDEEARTMISAEKNKKDVEDHLLQQQQEQQQQQHSQKEQRVRFLCLGGMNAFSRKQIDVVVRAFELLATLSSSSPSFAHKQPALLLNTKIELLVTNQNECEAVRTNALLESFKKSNKEEDEEKTSSVVSISVLCKALTYHETMALYENVDVVIQVSKHEGLGIGFYEALAHGKPVVTLDVPPHCELIIPEVNGWRIPAEIKPSVENVDSPIGSAYFAPEVLANCIKTEIVPVMISAEKKARLLNSLKADYVTRLSPGQFAERFLRGLRLF